MKLATVLILSTVTLALPASALGTSLAAPIPVAHPAQGTGVAEQPQQPLNVASDRTALSAYATYLNALVKAAPTAQAYATSYVSMISSQCKSALEPLTQPNEQVDARVQQVLTALGEEMGDDLLIELNQSALLPFDRFSNAISRLRWTRLAGAASIVRRYINTETTVLGLAPSSLCQNALLAASAPHVVPPGTRAFNKTYARASRAANASFANLLKLMQTYEQPHERAIVTRIANLAADAARLTQAELTNVSASLQRTLETT